MFGIATFAAVWLALLAYTSLAPPVDNIEQLTWVRSLEWGYYKHPPLTTWLFWIPAHLFGLSAWTTYFTGAVVTLAAVLLQWHLLRELRGARHATLAMGAVLCITYYNDRLYYYNHNVVLMLFAMAACWVSWRAFTTRDLRWWLAVGAVTGLGCLVKYQMAVAMACIIVCWLHVRGWRDRSQRTGLLLAGLVALLILVPHLQWLREHDFGPIRYALESSLGADLPSGKRALLAANWAADQVFNRALPAWLLLGTTLYFGSRRMTRLRQAPDLPETPRAALPGRALLVIWGVVPLVFIPAVGLVAGAELQLQWGTPFLLFAVPALMELVGSRDAWARWRFKPTLNVFVALQLIMLAINFITSPRGPAVTRDTHWRSFPTKDLARALEAPARHALAGRPICVVSGPAALAGAVALELPEHPLVLIDGLLERSPWVNAHSARPCGVLELSDAVPYRDPVGMQFPGLTWQISTSLRRR